jgi:intracellular sulfur oxidation DsrE/DsrF family protein
MKTIILFLAGVVVTAMPCLAQPSGDPVKAKQDSLMRATAMQDSLRMEKAMERGTFPYVKGSRWSGAIPVANPTEIPDLKRQYKLLFEITMKNPDPAAGEINYSLDEVARILNLHVASGIPAKNITPVIVIHGPGLEAIVTDGGYRKRHAIDNPSMKLIRDFERVGTKFIACGQAMALFGFEKDELLPAVRISLTAQTVLSNYQEQGYVRYLIVPDR